MSDFNRYNENHVQAMKLNVVDISQGMIDGRVGVIEGSRKLASIRHDLEYLGDREDYYLFVEIDSDTDHLPIDPAVRKNWSQEALARVDAEIGEYERRLKLEVDQACTFLIRRFSM